MNTHLMHLLFPLSAYSVIFYLVTAFFVSSSLAAPAGAPAPFLSCLHDLDPTFLQHRVVTARSNPSMYATERLVFNRAVENHLNFSLNVHINGLYCRWIPCPIHLPSLSANLLLMCNTWCNVPVPQRHHLSFVARAIPTRVGVHVGLQESCLISGSLVTFKSGIASLSCISQSIHSRHMNYTKVDMQRGVATVEAGASLGSVYTSVAQQSANSLALAGGTCPDVCRNHITHTQQLSSFFKCRLASVV